MHLVKEVLFMYNTLGHWKVERGQGWGQLLYIPPRCLSSELFKQAVGSCLALHIWVLPASYLEHLCLGFRLGNKSLWASGSQQPPLSYVTVLSTMCKLKSFTFQKVLNGWVCGLSCRMFFFCWWFSSCWVRGSFCFTGWLQASYKLSFWSYRWSSLGIGFYMYFHLFKNVYVNIKR